MTKNMKLRDEAHKASIQIRRAAENGGMSSQEFRFKVDFLRDSIIELATRCEFGYVAELSNTSMRLLNQAALQNRSSKFKLSVEDMLYLINTFPSAPDGVTSYVSKDFEVNRQIVGSVVRSNRHSDTHFIADNFLLMLKLAKNGDIASWINLSQATLELPSQADLVVRTFSLFDTQLVSENRDKLGYLVESLKNFNAGYFPDEYMGEMVKYDNLLYNLKVAGDVAGTHSIIRSGRGKFTEEFTLQRYMADFAFEPDELYRSQASQWATARDVDPGHKHLGTSFFVYELSTELPVCRIGHTPKASLIKSVLELDGAQSPYGIISLNQRKVGQFLDETLKLALKDLGDWDKVVKTYQSLGENVLMKSNLYKGKRLTEDLGM